MVPTWQWVSLFACILGGAFFAAAETSLTALGEARVSSLIEGGTLRGSLLKVWRDRPEGVLAALLLGSTLVNVALGTLSGLVAAHLGFGEALLGITGLAGLAMLILGEITPNALAKQHPSGTALALIPLVTLFFWVVYPLVVVLAAIPRALHRRMGLKAGSESITSEELGFLIEQGARTGNFDKQKEELLSSVLSFTEMLVKEIMVPRTQVIALDETSTYDEVLKLVTESELSRIPVFKETMDEVVGILHTKRLLAESRRAVVGKFQIVQYTKPPFFVPEVMKVSKLLTEMQRRKTHMAVVVDEFGGTAGIVTLEDVMEEIVGEIHDESDIEEKKIKVLQDGIVLADAQVTIRDLEEHLQVDFPDESDYDTLGGFLTSIVGRVPPTGSKVVWRGLSFTVRAADEKRVLKVEISKKAPGVSLPPPPGSAPPAVG
jgi:CBS domain containing-hemolysin-like protein